MDILPGGAWGGSVDGVHMWLLAVNIRDILSPIPWRHYLPGFGKRYGSEDYFLLELLRAVGY